MFHQYTTVPLPLQTRQSGSAYQVYQKVCVWKAGSGADHPIIAEDKQQLFLEILMSNDVKVLAVFSTCVTCVTCVTCKFHFCCLDSCLGQLTRRSKNGDSEVSAVSALQHLAAEATKPRSLPR